MLMLNGSKTDNFQTRRKSSRKVHHVDIHNLSNQQIDVVHFRLSNNQGNYFQILNFK